MNSMPEADAFEIDWQFINTTSNPNYKTPSLNYKKIADDDLIETAEDVEDEANNDSDAESFVVPDTQRSPTSEPNSEFDFEPIEMPVADSPPPQPIALVKPISLCPSVSLPSLPIAPKEPHSSIKHTQFAERVVDYVKSTEFILAFTFLLLGGLLYFTMTPNSIPTETSTHVFEYQTDVPVAISSKIVTDTKVDTIVNIVEKSEIPISTPEIVESDETVAPEDAKKSQENLRVKLWDDVISKTVIEYTDYVLNWLRIQTFYIKQYFASLSEFWEDETVDTNEGNWKEKIQKRLRRTAVKIRSKLEEQGGHLVKKFEEKRGEFLRKFDDMNLNWRSYLRRF